MNFTYVPANIIGISEKRVKQIALVSNTIQQFQKRLDWTWNNTIAVASTVQTLCVAKTRTEFVAVVVVDGVGG